jgi:hypothetical protein
MPAVLIFWSELIALIDTPTETMKTRRYVHEIR